MCASVNGAMSSAATRLKPSATPACAMISSIACARRCATARRRWSGNRGFARFLTLDKGAVAIDAAAIEADARFDGIFVLRTNTEHPADEVARLYKGLWRVERAFREVKSTLEIRPLLYVLCPSSRRLA